MPPSVSRTAYLEYRTGRSVKGRIATIHNERASTNVGIHMINNPPPRRDASRHRAAQEQTCRTCCPMRGAEAPEGTCRRNSGELIKDIGPSMVTIRHPARCLQLLLAERILDPRFSRPFSKASPMRWLSRATRGPWSTCSRPAGAENRRAKHVPQRLFAADRPLSRKIGKQAFAESSVGQR